VTRAEQRLADLEAEVAELRAACDDVRAIRNIVEGAVAYGQAITLETAEAGKYRAAAEASRPGPRHLRAIPGGAR